MKNKKIESSTNIEINHVLCRWWSCLITSTEDVFSIVAVVMDGGGWGTVALTTPQQSGSTPFLVKYPYLQKINYFIINREIKKVKRKIYQTIFKLKNAFDV